MPRYTINPKKQYSFPNEVRIVCRNDKYLVIAPELATWIVLENESQVTIFKLFQNGHTIEDALNNTSFDQPDIKYVVTQIEARRFYIKDVHGNIDGDRSLHLYLTNRCNLSCPHCYMFAGIANKNELTTEEVIQLITDYRKIAGGEQVTLSGGEPSIRPDFETIVKAAAEQGLKVRVLTNGVSLNKRVINRLARYIGSIQISIDGYSEESNAIIRGKGNFRKALATVDLCILNGINTEIAITPTLDLIKGNEKNYLDFAVSLKNKYTGKNFRIKFSEELLTGRSIAPDIASRKEYLSIMQKIQFLLYGPNYEIYDFVSRLGHNKLLENCMFGVFSVTSDGNVFPCPRTGSLLPIANIRTSPFKEICERAKLAEQATNVTKLIPCRECDLRFICGGGCRIDEFPELVKKRSFKSIDYNREGRRECHQEIKDKFYDLMIKSNRYFYTVLDKH